MNIHVYRKPITFCNGWSLHYCGSRTVLAVVVPDLRWPDMWRIMWPAGGMSDMGNLARIRDAAVLIASRGPPFRSPDRLQWRCYETPANGVWTRWPGKNDPAPEKLEKRERTP
jgi:hypothetical protein